jgi:hypothetical protein
VIWTVRRPATPVVELADSRCEPLLEFPEKRGEPLLELPENRGEPLLELPENRGEPLAVPGIAARAAVLRPLPYARGRGSRRLGAGSSPTSTGLRNLDSYSSARRARAAAALSLIALFRRLRG